MSLRTLHRDLATLRDLGVPVEGLAGRGGGVYLERGWSLGRVHLNETEAIGLLPALAIAQQVGSPLLLGDIRAIERKVAQAFSPGQASRIRSLRRRVIVGPPASAAASADHGVASSSVTRALLDGFLARRPLAIDYRDRAGSPTTRSVEVHYLYFRQPIWYALAWDRLRGDVRAFRLDRIMTARAEVGTFTVGAAARYVDAAEAATRHL